MYPTTTVLNEETFKFEFTIDKTKKLPIKFFTKGDPVHLVWFYQDGHSPVWAWTCRSAVYLMGADSLGRDMFARILYGGQISMTVGLLGVALSIIFGAILGTASGYFMGVADDHHPAYHRGDLLLPHHPLVGRPGGRPAAGFGRFHRPAPLFPDHRGALLGRLDRPGTPAARQGDVLPLGGFLPGGAGGRRLRMRASSSPT